MAKNETRKLDPKTLANDLEAYGALKGIVGYAPTNPAYSVASMTTRHTALLAADDAEAQALAAFEAARDNRAAAQWDMHNGMLGVKDQVIAQFGPDSNEVQALGLKKKTEYKSPTKKKAGAPV